MLGCGQNVAYLYAKGGKNLIREFIGVTEVTYNRVRDDISRATVKVQSEKCCDLLSNVRTILHELHIRRNGVLVWRGPITRIEWGLESSAVYAQDMLWQTTRHGRQVGFDYRYPNIAQVGYASMKLLDECYREDGDPWNMLRNLHWMKGPNEPETSKQVNAKSSTTFEELDSFGAQSGIDYTCVAGHVYLFDTQLAWKRNADLTSADLSVVPDIVEYGNDLATRIYTTNNSGLAVVSTSVPGHSKYGWVDFVASDRGESGGASEATPEEEAAMESQGERRVTPAPPIRVRIPANTGLLPTAPWSFSDLVPGAFFRASVRELCRPMVSWQKINEIVVTQTPENGESIAMTSDTSPQNMILP